MLEWTDTQNIKCCNNDKNIYTFIKVTKLEN